MIDRVDECVVIPAAFAALAGGVVLCLATIGAGRARPPAYGAALNVAAFHFMTWLSVAKPWIKTPWARPSTAWAVQPVRR